MKHIRKDEAFIYYYAQQQNRKYVGIRVGRSGAYRIGGDSAVPEAMPVIGKLHKIPLNESDASPEFLEAKRLLVNKELDAVLAGNMTFFQALRSK